MAAIEISGLAKSFGAVARAARTSTFPSAMASSWSWSARRAAASRPCCACSPGSRRPSAGTIAIGGRDVTDLPAKARDIAMVFQSYALYPHMTVAENMAFSLRVRQVDEA